MGYTVHGVAKSQTRLSDFHFHSERSGSHLMPCPALPCLDTRGDSVAGSRGNLEAVATITARDYKPILKVTGNLLSQQNHLDCPNETFP